MKLMILSACVFLIVSLFSLTLSFEKAKRQTFHEPQKVLAYNTSSKIIPLLKNDAVPPVVSAQGALAVDLDTGVSLYQKDADKKLFPASTTKIMTALIALENYSLDEALEVKRSGVEGQKMRLILGERMKVENLLNGLLIFSANDAAEVFADNFPEGRESYVDQMNKLARKLNLADTWFENPTGLDGNSQVTSARDMVRLTSYAMKNPIFRIIVSTKELTVYNIEGTIPHKLKNLNELLGEVEGVVGVKTGWTENARENLVTYVERGDRRIAMVLLGSQDRFGETRELIEWIFGEYDWVYSP